MGLFLLLTIAFFSGHSIARHIRSLALLTQLTRSAALHFATLALLACSIHKPAHYLHSLSHGSVDAKNEFHGNNLKSCLQQQHTKCLHCKRLRKKKGCRRKSASKVIKINDIGLEIRKPPHLIICVLA